MNQKFEIALADQQAAAADQQFTLTLFDLPGKPGGSDETYAAVRPVEGAFLMLTNIAARAQQDTADQVVAVLQFLDSCFVEVDLRAALIEAAEKNEKDFEYLLPVESDLFMDEDLSDTGVNLVRSNKRLYGRLMDRSDPLGPATLAGLMKDLVEGWSGNPIGSPSDYLPPQKSTGRRSTGKRSSAASTSPKSSAAPRRGSARRSTTSAPEA